MSDGEAEVERVSHLTSYCGPHCGVISPAEGGKAHAIVGHCDPCHGEHVLRDKSRPQHGVGAVGPSVPGDSLCRVCSLDDRNATHHALERTGHLSHAYEPTVPYAAPAGSVARRPTVLENGHGGLA